MDRLRREARRRGMSIAAVLREAVDRMIPPSADERQELARQIREVAGQFHSGTGDLPERHDELAGEADW